MSYVWTDRKPEKPGWYWLKDGSATVVVQVEIGIVDGFHMNWVWFAGSARHDSLDNITGQWSSTRIEEPTNE